MWKASGSISWGRSTYTMWTVDSDSDDDDDDDWSGFFSGTTRSAIVVIDISSSSSDVRDRNESVVGVRPIFIAFNLLPFGSSFFLYSHSSLPPPRPRNRAITMFLIIILIKVSLYGKNWFYLLLLFFFFLMGFIVTVILGIFGTIFSVLRG